MTLWPENLREVYVVAYMTLFIQLGYPFHPLLGLLGIPVGLWVGLVATARMEE